MTISFRDSSQSRLLLFCCSVNQSCLTLCDPMECSQPVSSVHGILQARILEWVAVLFSSGSSQPRDWTQLSHTEGGFSTIWTTREIQQNWSGWPIPSLGDLPNPGIEPGLLHCREKLYPLSHQGSCMVSFKPLQNVFGCRKIFELHKVSNGILCSCENE